MRRCDLAGDRRQAVLSEISRRISAHLDLQVTLDAVVSAAAELIPCALAEVSLWNPTTEMLTLLAIRCDPARAYPVGQSFPLGEGYTSWMVRHRQPLFVPDVSLRQDVRPHLLPGEKPFNAYLGVPLLSGEQLIGTLVLVADEAGTFGSEDQDVLRTLGHHAATAIRNAQLFDKVQRQARRLSALNAVASVINQALPLQDIMDQTLATVIEVMEADAGGIRLYDPTSGEMVVAAFQGLSSQDVDRIARLNLGEGYGERLARFREPLVLGNLDEIPLLAEIAGYDFNTHAYAPVTVQGATIGALGVVSQQRREFTADELDLLTTIGNQIGVAIENHRLREQAVQAERMAAVGRVATSVAHDLRSPLGGIVRSAEFLARPEISLETRQKLSQAVVSLAHRLINASQEILDYVRGEQLPLRLTACSLSEFLDQVLAVMEIDFAERGIEVVRQCEYTGPVLMDSDRLAQVVYNIGANARDAMLHGGTFTVTTREVDGRIELAFADTGPGVPVGLEDRIFEPFFSQGKREGAGLGLAIARRIVEEHGGTLRLEAGAGEGAVFVASLPA
jgi:signal transduction histidine kinase